LSFFSLEKKKRQQISAMEIRMNSRMREYKVLKWCNSFFFFHSLEHFFFFLWRYVGKDNNWVTHSNGFYRASVYWHREWKPWRYKWYVCRKEKKRENSNSNESVSKMKVERSSLCIFIYREYRQVKRWNTQKELHA
jgi:hypothetical protein